MNVDKAYKWLKVGALLLGGGWILFKSYDNVQLVPQLQAAVTGHETRLATVEAKLDLIMKLLEKIDRRLVQERGR